MAIEIRKPRPAPKKTVPGHELQLGHAYRMVHNGSFGHSSGNLYIAGNGVAVRLDMPEACRPGRPGDLYEEVDLIVEVKEKN